MRPPRRSADIPLTPRQAEVLALILHQQGAAEIARTLGTSRQTIFEAMRALELKGYIIVGYKLRGASVARDWEHVTATEKAKGQG